MSAINFPDPRGPTQEGVIALGGKLTPENLIEAYSHGIFPWPHEGYPLLWFCPDDRGVLDFSDIHLPKSFLKWKRNQGSKLKITSNQNFIEVIQNCRRQKRPDQNGTWINKAMEKGYIELHKLGGAHSIEVWQDEIMVGGIYGVQSKHYFSCESMFFKVSNASKLALYELIQFLKAKNQSWMDIQMVTDVSGQFGGKLISKKEFLTRIKC